MASLKSKYPLVIGEDQTILRTVCKPIETITPTIRTLAKAMSQLVHEYDGVGLAAPQLGYDMRLIVTTQRKILKGEYKLKSTNIMINPEIVSHSVSMVSDEEGCLSLPEVFGQVARYTQVTVIYKTLEGKKEQKVLSGLDAVIVQHEIDHINGVLFIDKATSIRHG